MKSPKYDLVAYYYESKLWTKGMVRAAVDRWITAKEASEILGEQVTSENNSTFASRIQDTETAINNMMGGEANA